MENNEIKNNEQDITIPQNAEQSVLGSILLSNEAIVEVASILKPDDFYYNAHQIIYKAMLELYQNSVPIDFTTLAEKIRTFASLDDIGGVAYIPQLPSITDATENVEYYAKIVKEKSKLREVRRTIGQINSDISSGKSIENILDLAEKSIFDIALENEKKDLEHIKSVLTATYDIIEQHYKRDKNKLTGVDTGFIDLNFMTDGFQKTDLIIIGARPATGKTAFSLNIANNAAKKGAKVAVFSLEMSKIQLTQRLLAASAKVELSRIKNGTLEQEEWIKIIDAISNMNKNNLYINDTAGINLMQIRSQCRKLKMQKGLDMILIDYIQLMESETRTENRQQEISKISRGLKILAKELDCVVIALSQISRASESRSNHRPMLSDLRESGAIEQDADMVMFLYRDELYNPDTDKKNITEVIVAKHRNGEIGSVDLAWNGGYQLFMDLERGY